MTAALMAAKFAGKGLTAYSQLMEAQATAEGYAHEAGNAEMAATEIENKAGYDSWRMDKMGRGLLGQQRAAYAAAGVDLSGTAIDNLAESAKQLTLDKLMMQRSAQVQATQQRSDAAFNRQAAKSAQKRGLIEAIGSFLT